MPPALSDELRAKSPLHRIKMIQSFLGDQETVPDPIPGKNYRIHLPDHHTSPVLWLSMVTGVHIVTERCVAGLTLAIVDSGAVTSGVGSVAADGVSGLTPVTAPWHPTCLT